MPTIKKGRKPYKLTGENLQRLLGAVRNGPVSKNDLNISDYLLEKYEERGVLEPFSLKKDKEPGRPKKFYKTTPLSERYIRRYMNG